MSKQNRFKINDLAGPGGPAVITLFRNEDTRGEFVKLFCDDELGKKIGFIQPIQVNTSITKTSGTIRGLHFQREPFSDAKIIFCLKGAINDYLVDVHEDSENFGKAYKISLSGNDGKAIFIPKGFAHGFQTLENETQLLYLHDKPYQPEAEAGFSMLSDELEIDLELPVTEISERDAALPKWRRIIS